MNRSPATDYIEKPVLVYGGSCLLIFIAVHCTIGAVVSSFSIPVEMVTLFWVWLFSTVIVTPVTVKFRGKGLLLLLIPAFILFLFNFSSIVNGGMLVINEITYLYGRWLPITELFPDVKDVIDSPHVFIAAFGVILTFLLAISICLRRSVFITIIITAPFIFLTFVITDLQADLIYMFGIIATYLTLLISSAYNPDNFVKRGQAYIPSFLIAITIMFIVNMFAPQSTYAREVQIATLGSRFRGVISQMGRFGQFWQLSGSGNWGYNWLGRHEGGVWFFNTETVDIAGAGRRIFSDQSLLEITVSHPGIFYLHGYTMNHFDGRSWKSNNESLHFDYVSITWPSMFNDPQLFLADGYDAYVMASSNGVLLHQIQRLRRQHMTLREEIAALLDTDEEEDQMNDEDGDMYNFTEEVLEMQHRLMEIELDLAYYMEELLSRYNPNDAYAFRVDLSRTMPALLAEFYSIDNINNVPYPAIIEIRRTGDLTTDVLYQPYFGGVFYGDDDNTEALNVFYYIDGNVHELADAVSDKVFASIFGIDETFDFISIPDELLDLIYLPIDNLNFQLLGYSEYLQRTGIYTEIEPYTANRLRQLARDAGIDTNNDRAVIVDAVANYVMTSGIYTLTPEQIPPDEDYVLYFLQESYGGYCIHFATAAVMMLRSLDIPARFTTGYAVQVASWQVGTPVVVTDRNAHAWVEVFYEGIGWLYLEATPSGGDSFIPERRPHSPGLDSDVPRTPPPLPNLPNGDYDYLTDDDYGAPDDNASGNTAGAGVDNNRQQNRVQLPVWLSNLIIVFSGIVLALITLVVRRRASNRIREKRFEQPNANKAVICMWKHIIKLGSVEIVAPDDIEELALKARFSQHRISEEERDIMMSYAKRLTFEISEATTDIGRLWLKYIRALS